MMEDPTVPAQRQPMMRFARAHLNSGDAIELSSGITVIVGPNNVGKSVLLRNLAAGTGPNAQPSYPICSSIEVDQVASLEAVIAWCKDNLPSRDMPVHGPVYMSSQSGEFFEGQLQHEIAHSGHIDPRWFTLFLQADGRADHTQAQAGIDYIHEPPTSPLQRLWLDDALERELCRLVERAFNSPIEVSKIAGSRITLHLGATGVSPVERTAYMQAITRLPEVHTQGHGLRSFVGMLLQIIAGDHFILLIDEPETFLHPPQARLFGEVLSQLRRTDMQIILATHSTDVLQGLVDKQQDDSSLSIVRLTRDTQANINRASRVDPDMIEALSRDPLLRHSAILDGLFYHGTVLCEADGDATFYAAVNANIARDNSEGGQALDLLFTHTNGGYGRLPGAVRALTSANVPVVSVLDLDVLGNVEVMAKLLEAYGTRMETLGLTQLFSQVRNHVQQMATDPTRKQFMNAVKPMLDRTGNHLTADELNELKPLLETRTGWKQLKSLGVKGVTGTPGQALDSIVAKLREVGIFVVPVGELESFDTRAPQRPKAAWLEHVLANRIDERPGEHRSFVEDIRSHFRQHQ